MGVASLAAGLALRDRGAEVEIHEKLDELLGRATGFSIWAYAIKRLTEWGFDRERDVAKIEKTGRRNEQLMMPTNALFFWARNEVLGHTSDEKLLELAEGTTGDES